MDERLGRVMDLDERFVMHTYRRLPVAFVRGLGTRLWDTAGREYIDMVSGLGAVALGHSHPRVAAAVKRQADAVMHTTNLYYVEPQAELASLVVENAFPGRCFFANSGAEANEGALKLARKHHFLSGRPRSKVVCAYGSFHGRTLATLSASGQPAKWEPFGPVAPGFVHVPLDDTESLESQVDGQTAAVMLEPVQGESGVYPVGVEFLKAARRLCDREGALLIFDEVQTGLGRTGSLFAYQRAQVIPDIMTLAKGLANGVPIGLFIAREGLDSVLAPGDHGSTFGGGFLACSAALETLRVIIEERLPENAERVGRCILERLRAAAEGLPAVTEVRGLGLMIALQLKTDIARDVVIGCMERGVLVNDVTPNAIRLLPPLVIEKDEAMRALDVLEDVLAGVTA